MNIHENLDSITALLAEKEEKLFQSAKLNGTREAIESFLAIEIPNLEEKLNYNISHSDLSEIFVISAQRYVSTRDNGITTEEIKCSIKENALDKNNSDPVSYLASIIFIQNLFSGTYKNQSTEELLISYNHIRSCEPSLSVEEKVEELLTKISIKNLNPFECEKDDQILLGTAIKECIAELPNETDYAIRSAVFYAATLNGEISPFNSNIHPGLFAAFICSFSDAASIVDKQMRNEISSLEAEQLLNKTGLILCDLISFILFIVLIIGFPLVAASIVSMIEISTTLGIIIAALIIILVVILPCCLSWEYLSMEKVPEMLSQIDKYRTIPQLPNKNQAEVGFIKKAIPFISNKNLNTI